MTAGEKDLGYRLLDTLMESLRDCPEVMEFPVELDDSPRKPGMSLSSAGKGTRFLAHMQVGSPKKEKQPRYSFGMKMGHVAHDLLRNVWGTHPAITVSDAERDVTVTIQDGDPPVTVGGHIDGFVEFEGLKILIDIKCVNLYAFNELDPRNPETNWWARSRKWAAGNYVFDAIEMFSTDDFKKAYLDQIAGYEAGLHEAGETWDATAFVLYCRDTSHLAVGIYSPEAEAFDAQLAIFSEKANAVLDNSDPFVYDTCWEAAVGSEPYKVCQYCDYLHECFDVKTQVFRGKPRMNILRIR